MSTLSKHLGRFASMESDEEQVQSAPVEVDEGGAPVDVANVAETAMVDAQEDEAVIEESSDEHEDLEDTAEALEAFLDGAVQSAKNDGGWSRKEAYLAQIAVEQIFSKIGCADVGTVMVSYENYSTSGDNMNRVVSLENVIMDALKDLWKKIKQVLNKMVAFVRKWYLKLLDGASRLKKRAQAIKKSADGKSGSTDKKKLEDSSLLKQVHIGKKAPTAAQITESLGIVKATTGETLSAAIGSDYADSLSTLSDSISEFTGDKSKIGVMMAALGGARGSRLSSITTRDISKSPRYESYTNSRGTVEIIGGKMIAFVGKKYEVPDAVKPAGTDNSSINVYGYKSDDFDDKKIDVDKGNLEMLSPSVVSGYCDKVIDILDDIIKYKAGWEKYESATKTFITKMDKITEGKVDDDSGKEQSTLIRFGAKVGNAMIKARAESSKNAINIGMSVSRAVLAYGNACLGAYKN